MDCSPPGSSVNGNLQAILEWVAMPFSRGSSWARDRTQVSRTAGRLFTIWATGKPLPYSKGSINITNHSMVDMPARAWTWQFFAAGLVLDRLRCDNWKCRQTLPSVLWGQNQPWLRTTVPYLSTVMSNIANYSQIAAFLSLLWAVIKYSVGHTLLRFFFKLHGSSDSVSTSFRLFENRTIPSVPWVLPQSPQSSPWHGVNTRKNLLRYCSLMAWKDLKAPGGPTWSQGDAI